MVIFCRCWREKNVNMVSKKEKGEKEGERVEEHLWLRYVNE